MLYFVCLFVVVVVVVVVLMHMISMEIYGDTCFYIAKEGNTHTHSVHNSSERTFASLTHIYAATADTVTPDCK